MFHGYAPIFSFLCYNGDMKTPIDFGKEFLHTFFDRRDADACQGMLAGDLVWITPENMHHFLSEGAVLSFLRKQIEEDGESRYADVVSIKSSPSADNIMTVAYEVNLVSGEEEKPLHLRCSMAICRRGRRLEITFLHFSKKSERDSSEQLREFVMNLPCGVMILACLDGRSEEAIFYNEYFARKLRYKEEEFARAVSRNPFFMVSEEDREKIHGQIAQAREKGGSLAVNLRVYRRDGNSFYYRMTGSPVFQADGGTVFYCIFQETTGFQLTAARLQGRLDSVTEILRQVPEGICVIEYPAQEDREKGRTAASAGAGGEKKDYPDDLDVKIYRSERKNAPAKERTFAAGPADPVSAETVSLSGPVKSSDTINLGAARAADTVSPHSAKTPASPGPNPAKTADTARPHPAKTADTVGSHPAKSTDTVGPHPAKSTDTVSLSPVKERKREEAETAGIPDLREKEIKSGTEAAGSGKENRKGSRVFYLSKNLPAMFGISNSAFTRNILQDPFYGLEMTSITRDRLLSSPVFHSEKAGAGKAVSCGIFRMRRPDGRSRRVELAARKTKNKEGVTRLFLFYYDREEQQQETENRVDRAMKIGRAGQDQLRDELRKHKEAAARRESELTAAAREAGEKHEEEISRFEELLVEEKNRSAIIARRLDKTGVEKTRLKEDLKKARTDASMRIRGLQSEMERRTREAEKTLAAVQEEAAAKMQETQKQFSLEMEKAGQRIKDAEAARSLLEEQLREAQERNRLLQEQLQKEKTQRLLLEAGFGDGEAPAVSRKGNRALEDPHGAGDWMTENDSLTVFSSMDPETEIPAAEKDSGTGRFQSAQNQIGIPAQQRGDLPMQDGNAPLSMSADQAVLIPGGLAGGSGGKAGRSAQVYASAVFSVPRQIVQQAAETPSLQNTSAMPSLYRIPRAADFRQQPAAPEPETAGERIFDIEKRIRERESDKAEQRLRSLMGRASVYMRTPQEKEEKSGGRKDAKYGYQICCSRENIDLLMEDFLDAASESSLLHEQVFSPENFLQNIMIFEGMACAEKEISLYLSSDSRLPDSVVGFRGLLQRALCGLVENSIAHTEAGGRIAVHVRADRPSEGLVNLHIRVEDNGEGIPADRMQTIFEAEKSGEKDAMIRSGLFAAREAAALMGGSIHARSRRGATRFLLSVSLRLHQ